MWFLRKIAWPISVIYGIVVHIRNYFFDVGLLRSKSYATPIICIGNLSVGGTGKTPMVEFLISRLQDDFQIAVLSRGYKRKSKGFQMASKNSTVEELGDEPFQIYIKYKNVTVAVDSDRQHGITELENRVGPDIILLDDAFQHRKVRPHFSILLTTYSNPYYKDWYLPTAYLRDAKSASKRADLVVVTKCPENLAQQEMDKLGKALKTSTEQKILFASLKYDDLLYGKESIVNIEELVGKQFTLVTGVANPQPLVGYLKSLDLKFEHLKFPDHHNFSPPEINLLKRKGSLVTTEKDFVRLKDRLHNMYYLKIEHRFIGNGEDILLKRLKEAVKPVH